MSNTSDHKLTRMKKGDIIKLFRETEEKLFGATVGHKMFVEETETEMQELKNRIDDYMVQEDMNKKTINELNESNKKLVEKVKFYQQQKENNKNKENKVADYVNNGLIEKIESLEVINKNLEKEKEELIEECNEKNKWNEKLQEHHDCSNERMQIYMGYLHDMEIARNNLRLNDEEILKSYK